ncbi:2-(1,2-epoxy-1,2-dihydrophenyl)acetyl-CoA isomerase [Nocardia jinanensis]|uniref:2-(1,2-epoxy-1,2-dihydrophenyl)acetyl-CoA isomerase n=1 Tax=Nocardia jinanensis TaxID=382504 RepID=A0A917RLS7_9NOCA|nr:2-(1,2-epoxy-1,2-dihydrophenyl)acetyl-CoA isomerase [Nocardia jinanensis]
MILARPGALNAFDLALQQELRAATDWAATEDSVRCVVLTGAGRAFSAGADLSLEEMSPELRLSPRTEEELRMRYNPTVRTLRSMPKPVIAAINGAAVGAGCALALACDQLIAARSASFTLAFAKVGLTLDAGASMLLGARVGLGRAGRMALLAERIDAETALSWGMVDEVVADEELNDRASELALRLAAGPTAAFAATKRSLNTALLPQLDAAFESEVEGQTRLVDSRDFREGVAAFAARRPPVFEGR